MTTPKRRRNIVLRASPSATSRTPHARQHRLQSRLHNPVAARAKMPHLQHGAQRPTTRCCTSPAFREILIATWEK
ncbi:hypothetical protein PSPO01_07137 [Paraphaeosphaeria sporulosa]